MASTNGTFSREQKDRFLTELLGKTIKVGLATAATSESDTYASITKSTQVPEQSVTFGAISGTTTRTISNTVAFSQITTGATDILTDWYAYYTESATNYLIGRGKIHDSNGNDTTKTINLGDTIIFNIGDLVISIT